MHQSLRSLVVMAICIRSIAAFSARAASSGTSTRIVAARHSSTTRTAASSRTISAFAPQQWGGTTKRSFRLYSTENGSGDTTSSTFDFDEDERSEQLLADPDRPIPPPPVPTTTSGINGVGAIDASKPAGGRYDDLLESVGLTGDDALTSLPSLNPLRPVSTNDVFCNRELRMGGLKAIGFDMDYTLGKLKIW